MKVTNHTSESLDFIVKGKAKDGVPPTGSVGPGKTEDIDVDVSSAEVKGRLHAGAISVTTEKVETADKRK